MTDSTRRDAAGPDPSAGGAPGVGRRICVTGGNGFLGTAVLTRLAATPGVEHLLSLDLRHPGEGRALAGVSYAEADVCSPEIAGQLREHRIDTVIHLAAIVNPGRDTSRDQEYRVDVGGSTNVLASCVAVGVHRIVVSSSGAAYGYHADNPVPLRETDPVRGNDEFPYSRHKRLVEEELARYRAEHPELEQTVFRIGTILGAGVRNQITALFDAPRLLKIAGSDSPFVFIWNEDVAEVMVRAAVEDISGTYNVAGDGWLGIDELAGLLGKRTVTVPPGLLGAALAIGNRLGLTVHGPEKVRFLRYRPVLDNTALKERFGYTPRYTSSEAFLAFLAGRRTASRTAA